METINNRIQQPVSELFDGNTSAFARAVPVSQSTLKEIVSGRLSKPSSDTLTAIASSDALNISAQWLLTGNGTMRTEVKHADLYDEIEAAAAELEAEGTPIASFKKGVPYYNVDFIGGFDLVGNDQTTKPDYYIDFSPYNEDGTIWCNITGHSMEPEINSGDMIALKEVQGWSSFLIYGEIYAIVTKDGMRTVKVVSKGDDNNSFKLIPINESEKYSIQDIPKAMIEKVFRVMGCMKRL